MGEHSFPHKAVRALEELLRLWGEDEIKSKDFATRVYSIAHPALREATAQMKDTEEQWRRTLESEARLASGLAKECDDLRAQRDRAFNEGVEACVRWHVGQAELAINSLHCGDGAGEIAHARRKSDHHKASSDATRALKRPVEEAPGHTNLMVTPESLDEYLEREPAPAPADDVVERAVQAAIDAGLAVNGEHCVGAARHAARFVARLLSPPAQGVEWIEKAAKLIADTAELRAEQKLPLCEWEIISILKQSLTIPAPSAVGDGWKSKRPVAFLVQRPGLEPDVFTNEQEAASFAECEGAEYHGLYLRTPLPEGE